jgi:hypothetical protein
MASNNKWWSIIAESGGVELCRDIVRFVTRRKE